MSRRYKNAPVKKSYNKNRVYQTTIYPSIPLRADDIYVYAKEGDRLDNLAFKYYGDVNNWWIIARANDIGKGSLYVTPGIQLRIPTHLTTIFNDFKKLNEIR